MLLPWFLGLPAQADDKLRVGKAIQNSFNFGMLDVGIASGVFKANGLDVEPVTFTGATRVQQALTSNDIDIGAAPGQDLGFVFKGLPAMTVAEMSHKPRETEMLVQADSADRSRRRFEGQEGRRSPTFAAIRRGSSIQLSRQPRLGRRRHAP